MTARQMTFDLTLSWPVVFVAVASIAGLGTSVAIAQTSIQNVERRLTTLEQQYRTVPERLASIETVQKMQTDTLKRIEENVKGPK